MSCHQNVSILHGSVAIKAVYKIPRQYQVRRGSKDAGPVNLTSVAYFLKSTGFTGCPLMNTTADCQLLRTSTESNL